MELNHRSPGVGRASLPLDHGTKSRGELRVRESHPSGEAYETSPGSGPPASCRPRYRAGRTSLMKARRAPAAPALHHPSDHGETRTPTPIAGTTPSTSCVYQFHHMVILMLLFPIRIGVAQAGFEPAAALVLSESGLPVAYRAAASTRPFFEGRLRRNEGSRAVC
jgi:hypothetical protein